MATNFDDDLVSSIAEAGLPVSTYFGSFKTTLLGSGRPSAMLPSVDEEKFRKHIALIHKTGRLFYFTINSSETMLKEYGNGFLEKFDKEISRLIDLGVDGFVIALPFLVKRIKRNHPDIHVSVSSFARIRTVNQALYFKEMGVRRVILEEANRDFRLIKGLVNAGMQVEVLVNENCLRECPYRFHHFNTNSICSQGYGVKFPYNMFECGQEFISDPSKLISSEFIRPEDLGVYEEMGVHHFKIAGRNATTPRLLKVLRAYASRKHEGNLLDILSFYGKNPLLVLNRLPGSNLIESLKHNYDSYASFEVDNSSFPKDFARKIGNTDCNHTDCQICGYCETVAKRVIRIREKPLSEFVSPEPVELSGVLPYLSEST